MTVYEAVKAYNLANLSKQYKDEYGRSCDLDIPLHELKDKIVKYIKIYPSLHTVEIHIVGKV